MNTISLNTVAKPLQVEVVTNKGSQLRNVVVYLTSDSPLTPTDASNVAIMDQVNSQFVPHILVVQRGALVDFPNSDSIKHHVYSFSPTKTFELQLYKDDNHAPELFDKSGRVEMGCNVHDWMLGYIYVVDTPYFGKTDDNGILSLDIPEGEYQVHIRHPRIQDDETQLTKNISNLNDKKVVFKLQNKLLPGHDLYEQNLDEFSDYD